MAGLSTHRDNAIMTTQPQTFKFAATKVVTEQLAPDRPRLCTAFGVSDEAVRVAQHAGLGLTRAGNPRALDPKHPQLKDMIRCYADDFPAFKEQSQALRYNGIGTQKDETITLIESQITGAPVHRHRQLAPMLGRVLLAMRHLHKQEGDPLKAKPQPDDVIRAWTKAKKDSEKDYDRAAYRLHDSYRELFDGPLAGELRKRQFTIVFALENPKSLTERSEQLIKNVITTVQKTSDQHNVKIEALCNLRGVFDPLLVAVGRDYAKRIDVGDKGATPVLDLIKLLTPLLDHVPEYGGPVSEWAYYSGAKTILAKWSPLLQNPDYVEQTVDPNDMTRLTCVVKKNTLLADVLAELPSLIDLADRLQAMLPDAMSGTGKQMRAIKAKHTLGPNDIKDGQKIKGPNKRLPYVTHFRNTPVSHDFDWPVIYPVFAQVGLFFNVVDGRLQKVIPNPYKFIGDNFKDFVHYGMDGGDGARSGYAYLITTAEDHIARDQTVFAKCREWYRDLALDQGVKFPKKSKKP